MGEAVDHIFALPPGYLLADYRLCRVLGYGGFGITYLAEDVNLHQRFAIKEYLPPDIAARDSTSVVRAITSSREQDFRWGRDAFLKEARIMGRPSHPNLVRVHRYFEMNGTAYIVMDYVEGERFDDVLSGFPEGYPKDTLNRIVGLLLDVVGVIHDASVLHRDIKPGNIILRADGIPVLLDFGAARDFSLGVSRSLTALVSTGYAPLEQYSTTGRQGPWTDIYSLAAVVYRAIAGTPPVEPLLRLRDDPLKPAVEVGSGRYESRFLAAVDHGLKLHPQDRPQSVQEWRQALCDSPPTTTQSNKRRRAEDRPGRARIGAGWRRKVALLAAPLLAAAGFGLYALLGRSPPPPPLPRQIVVDQSGAGDASSIATAIALAVPGSFITVRPGLYSEPLVLDRDVSVWGLADDPQQVSVVVRDAACLVSQAANASIRSISLRNEADGETGCVLVSGGRLTIEDVEATSASGSALVISGGAAVDARRLRVRGSGRHGIALRPGARAAIADSSIEESRKAGLHIADAELDLGNTRIADGGDVGIVMTQGARGRLFDSVVAGNALSGIEARQEAAPEVSGTLIEGNGEAGIYIHRGGGGVYSDNRIVSNGSPGVVLAGGSASFEDNRLEANHDDGVWVTQGGSARLIGNLISGNAGHGVAVDEGAQAVLSMNKIWKNKKRQVIGSVSYEQR
jgi:Protein kinase domain/Right handed beta helix region